MMRSEVAALMSATRNVGKAVDDYLAREDATLSSEQRRAEAAILKCQSLRAIDETRVEYDIDMIDLMGALPNPSVPLPSADAFSQDRARTMAQAVAKENAVDPTLTVERIVADFTANKLLAFPPQPSTPPEIPGCQ